MDQESRLGQNAHSSGNAMSDCVTLQDESRYKGPLSMLVQVHVMVHVLFCDLSVTHVLLCLAHHAHAIHDSRSLAVS